VQPVQDCSDFAQRYSIRAAAVLFWTLSGPLTCFKNLCNFQKANNADKFQSTVLPRFGAPAAMRRRGFRVRAQRMPRNTAS
jgi:hypothetical protein